MHRLAVACLLAAALAVPAHADPSPLGQVQIYVEGQYTWTTPPEVVGACAAVAVGAVSSLVIDQCYLTGSNSSFQSAGPTVGNVAVVVFAERVTTFDFALCWHAYAIPLFDPTRPVATGGCSEGLPTG